MSNPFTKQRLQFSLSLLIILILFGCTASPNSTADVGLAAMDTYIDPEIVGNERTVMRRILAALPDYARQDVVHLNDDGTLYTNRKANKGKGTVIRKEGNSDVWIDQAGNPYPLPMPTSEPRPSIAEDSSIETQAYVTPQCKLDGTGIEFRMHSKPGKLNASVPAFGGADVDVFVPSKASGELYVEDPSGYGCRNDKQASYGETPYVYLGGWGGVSANSRVDAGLQLNCPTATTGSYSDYTAALFFSKQIGTSSFMAVNDDPANGFKTGQTLLLRYYVRGTKPSTDPVGNQAILVVYAQGFNADGTKYQSKTITTNNNGWDLFGRHNILSLSASVAQTPRKFTVNGDPDYWVSAAPNPISKFGGIKFSNLRLTTSTPYIDDLIAVAISWNSYSYSDPLTDTAAKNGICRMPSNNTSSVDPIEVTGTSTATATGITVNLLVKK
jgi:hypothetical protein